MALWILAWLSVAEAVKLNTTNPLRKFAFGSCAGHFGMENPAVWYSILEKQPDLFLWAGDAVYADTMLFPLLHTYTPLAQWLLKFDRMKRLAGYRELREQTPIIGVWDDHDYGINNGDKNNIYKEHAQQFYLDFLDEPHDSPRRKQKGLQTSYVIGPKGKQVKFILLDVRYFRDPWSYDGDTLGEEQWTWLESELAAHADVNFVVSGMQVLPQDRFGVTERFHPKSAERLAQLVSRTPNTFILSGDVHISEVLKSTCYSNVVYEITSSGLTHTAYTQYGFLGMVYNYLVQPSTFNSGRRIFKKSYCLVSIDWKVQYPMITFTFVSDSGVSLMTEKVQLSIPHRSQRSEHCSMAPLERAVRHWAASFCVFVLPLLLHVAALVIFLRKWSHSF